MPASRDAIAVGGTRVQASCPFVIFGIRGDDYESPKLPQKVLASKDINLYNLPVHSFQ